MPEPWLEMDLGLELGAHRLRAQITSQAAAVGIAGPSGAGKTTLLRVLAGVERRATGTLRVRGENWQSASQFRAPWLRQVGWVPQESALFPHLDVRSNLGYAASAGLVTVARLLGLEHLLDRAPRHLSGGERQRVALGRALLARPRLLLLDEPFAALDRPLRARVAADLASWCTEQALPVVLVTHDARDLDAFTADRWELADGVLRTPAEMLSNPEFHR